MSKPCRHEFGAKTAPDPDSKKKLKFSYCPTCGGFMTSGTLTPTQKVSVQASVEQLRADTPPTFKRQA